MLDFFTRFLLFLPKPLDGHLNGILRIDLCTQVCESQNTAETETATIMYINYVSPVHYVPDLTVLLL